MAQPWLVDASELPAELRERIEAEARAAHTTVAALIEDAAQNRRSGEDARAAVARQFGFTHGPSVETPEGSEKFARKRATKTSQAPRGESSDETPEPARDLGANRVGDGATANDDAEEDDRPSPSALTLAEASSRYKLSHSVQRIVESASRFASNFGDAPIVGAGTLFRAAVYSGRESDSSRGELYAFVQSRCDGETFQRNFEPQGEGSSGAESIMLMKRAEEVFEAAQTIAERTTSDRTIHSRHFVAAFLVPIPGLKVVAYMTRSRHDRGVDIREFAPVLLAYLERKPYGASELPAWRTMLGTEARYLNLRTYPGFSSDSGVLPGEDALGVVPDAQAFAELICLKEASPPLSIGLFGNWGSGKTTFMDRLAMEIEALTRRVKQDRLDARRPSDSLAAGGRAHVRPTAPLLVSEVVQIKFNAWHYADGDIWASLTAEFFNQLRAGGFTKAVDNRYAVLVGEVARQAQDAEVVASSAEGDLVATRADIDRTKREIEDARIQLETAERRVFARQASVIIDQTLLANKDEIDRAGQTVGIADLSGKPDAFRDQVRGAMDAFGKLKLIANAVAGSRWKAVLFILGAILLSALVLFVGTIDGAMLGAWLASLFTSLSLLALPLRSAYGAVKPIINASADFAEALAKDRKELDDKIAAKQKELNELEENAKKKADDLSAARKRASNYITQSEAAHRSLLRYFLFENAETRDYEKHLGIVSRARRSFERLNAILLRGRELRESRERAPAAPFELDNQRLRGAVCATCEKQEVIELRTVDQCRNCGQIFEKSGEPITAEADPNKPAEVLPDIDRIVLYIDDLDRCRHQQVVRVLEAVHLLLAFDLFVVVVGVDARWMRSALAKYYQGEFGASRPGKRAAAADTGDRHATPDDYLEKIFQIPFWLRRLTHGEDGTYAALVDSLTRLDMADSRRKSLADGARHDEAAKNGARAPNEQRENNANSRRAAGDEAAAQPPDDDLAAHVGRVRLTPNEVALLKKLGPVTGESPRMTKRFLNLYRLVRARRTGASLARFLGEDGSPPEYPTVVFLLALATGLDPSLAKTIVDEMAAGAGLSEAVAVALPPRPVGVDAESTVDAKLAAGAGPSVKKLASKPIGVGAKSPAGAKLEFLAETFGAGGFAVAPLNVRNLAPIVARYSFHHLYSPPVGS